jgi:hypothetical protein
MGFVLQSPDSPISPKVKGGCETDGVGCFFPILPFRIGRVPVAALSLANLPVRGLSFRG